MRSAARHALTTAVVLAVSCGDPVGPCGCSPPVPSGVLRGMVIDMAGRPVGAATIKVGAVPGSSCGSQPRVHREVRSGSDGRFLAHYSSNYCADPLYAAWAEPLAGSPWLASEPATFKPWTSTGAIEDTAVVEIVLRDPP